MMSPHYLHTVRLRCTRIQIPQPHPQASLPRIGRNANAVGYSECWLHGSLGLIKVVQFVYCGVWEEEEGDYVGRLRH